MSTRGMLFTFFLVFQLLKVQSQEMKGPFPDSIYSGEQGKFHMQGAAVDTQRGHVYFSFTNKLIKTDLSGKVIGSVTGFVGHLGDLALDSETGILYGSLEYKSDAIGAGISKSLGIEAPKEDGFYIVMFNCSKIVRPDMPAEEEGLLQSVYLKEVIDDFQANVKVGNEVKQHRHACSGIDGVALGPAFGKAKDSKKYLYVAYGVYGDGSRNDNDHQVILQYDVADWGKYRAPIIQGRLHQMGPDKPRNKYFVETGNSTYGIQNLEYDAYTGNFYAAVYKGKKEQFPNYDLFVLDGSKVPFKGNILSDNKKMKVQKLPLLAAGPKDPRTGIRGWSFKWGSTGLLSLGNGQFYISHNFKSKAGIESAVLHKYQWIGSDPEAFRLIK